VGTLPECRGAFPGKEGGIHALVGLPPSSQRVESILRIPLSDKPDRKMIVINLLLTTCGLYYKCFTVIIYDPNDSGQNYKTTFTIVIDDPSLS
jgi:hypothetical protein